MMRRFARPDDATAAGAGGAVSIDDRLMVAEREVRSAWHRG